ncbi:PREDICTED: diamine acetyltransferase 2 [Rhagoletis zephyria]|uniref:diamine acetyltransferase 2 n=1 Tax=Rhagoletis zephyria TaxID=28612 RepID=UPI0008112656|nr:PREDICTED: diamine acetyltransferase 2 [Rhagoletis zephyria]XP_017478868.1 PREDICTED: diamine acetyltransferase 2 [Rhagoletis zephyria]XP_036344570.1 diamine acetyltransferase 2-like [Rhagoletis pomonella]
METNQKFTFRRAKIEDIAAVRQMIQELADFEKMSDGPKITEKDLVRDAGLDGGQEYCHIYVLEVQTEEKPTLAIIGYCICFYSYSTWQGKTYFLEDVYVRPAYRGLGAGAYIFRAVAAKAKEYNCQRLDFHVLGWNPARKFYDRMGAIDLTETEEWHFYRVNAEQIEKLANEL